MNVNFIRLVTGEAIIANIVESTDSHCVIENPAQITMQQASPDPNDIKLALVDFLPFAEKDKKHTSIDWLHILYSHQPTATLRNAYSKMFGSGVIIPPTGVGLHSV